MTRVFGRYVLEERIAMGGMAEIFRAHTATEGFQKRVCIKRILPHFLTEQLMEQRESGSAEEGDFVTMFRDEARTAAKLQHANVVQVFDFGEEEKTLYLAMELVDGADLRRVMEASRKKKIPIEIGEAIQIAVDVCRGLHHAHTLVENGKPLGVVHRDVSPHNILLSKAGEVKVTDFGIARAAERVTHTSTGIVKGKVAYMSPEQAQGLDFDHRLDQFALGVVLWEMLCGLRLFSGENDATILRKVMACDVPVPSSIRRDVPKPLDDIVLRALSAAPADRFPDMRAMELALSRVLYSGAVDPATADVRHVFTRIMAPDPKAEPQRKTSVMPPVEVAAAQETIKRAEDLDLVSSTESGPKDLPSSDVSMVFSSSEKNPPAPGPSIPTSLQAQKNAVSLPPSNEGAAVAPVADANAHTKMAAGSDELRAAMAPMLNSGKNAQSPQNPMPVLASPAPSMTAPTLPSLEDLEALDEASKPAPDATPATRTNVPHGEAKAEPKGMTSAPPVALVAPLTSADESASVAALIPKSRLPLVAATAGAVVVAGVALFAITHAHDVTAPVSAPVHDVIVPAAMPQVAAPVSAPVTAPVTAPVSDIDAPVTAPVIAPAHDVAAAASAHVDAPAHAAAKPPIIATKRVRVVVKAEKGYGHIYVDGAAVEVTHDGTIVELPPGKLTLKTLMHDNKTTRTVAVVVAAGAPLVISFD